MIRSFVEASSFLATVSIVKSWILLKEEYHESLLKKTEKLHKQAGSLVAEYKQIQEKVKNNYWDEIYRSKLLHLKSGRKINQKDMEEFVMNIIGDEVISEIEYSDSISWSSLVAIIEDSVDSEVVSDEFRLIPTSDLNIVNDLMSSNPNLPLVPFLLNITAQNEIVYDYYTSKFTLQLGRVINLIRNVAMSDVIGPNIALSTIKSLFLVSLGVYAVQIPLLNRLWPTASFLPNTSLFRQFIPSFKSAGLFRGFMLSLVLVSSFTNLGKQYYLFVKDDKKSEVFRVPKDLIFGNSGSSNGIPVVYPGATKDDPFTQQRLWIYLFGTPLFENALLLGVLFPRLLHFGGGVVAYPLTALVAFMMTHFGAEAFDAKTIILNLTRNESNLFTVTSTLVLAGTYHLTGKLIFPLFFHICFNIATLKAEYDDREDIRLEKLYIWNEILHSQLILDRINHMNYFVMKKLRSFGYYPLPPTIATATGEPSKELQSIAEKAVRCFSTHSLKRGGAATAGAVPILNYEDFADFMIAFDYAIKLSSTSSNSTTTSSSSSSPSPNRNFEESLSSTDLRSTQSSSPERKLIREVRQLLTELRNHRINQINQQQQQQQSQGGQGDRVITRIDLKINELLTQNDDNTLVHLFFHDRHLRNGYRNYPRGIDANQLAAWMLYWLTSLDSKSLNNLNMQQLQNEIFYWYRIPTSTNVTSSSSSRNSRGNNNNNTRHELIGARDDILDLIQEYYTRILEVDQFAAAEIVRVHGPIFVNSLAGRRPTAEDVQRYNTEAQLYRKLAIRREAFSVLADYGLTPRRFGLLLKDQIPRYQAVKELNQQWIQYFDTLDYKKKWVISVNPFPGAKFVTDKDLK